MEYHLALEKAVLDYAVSAVAHPQQNDGRYIQIPGYMDNHVWAMAAGLSERGLIKTSKPNGSAGVGVSSISDSGTSRLKELVAEEQQLLEAKRIQMEESLERARQKKWWRRMVKKGPAPAGN